MNRKTITSKSDFLTSNNHDKYIHTVNPFNNPGIYNMHEKMQPKDKERNAQDIGCYFTLEKLPSNDLSGQLSKDYNIKTPSNTISTKDTIRKQTFVEFAEKRPKSVHLPFKSQKNDDTFNFYKKSDEKNDINFERDSRINNLYLTEIKDFIFKFSIDNNIPESKINELLSNYNNMLNFKEHNNFIKNTSIGTLANDSNAFNDSEIVAKLKQKNQELLMEIEMLKTTDTLSNSKNIDEEVNKHIKLRVKDFEFKIKKLQSQNRMLEESKIELERQNLRLKAKINDFELNNNKATSIRNTDYIPIKNENSELIQKIRNTEAALRNAQKLVYEKNKIIEELSDKKTSFTPNDLEDRSLYSLNKFNQSRNPNKNLMHPLIYLRDIYNNITVDSEAMINNINKVDINFFEEVISIFKEEIYYFDIYSKLLDITNPDNITYTDIRATNSINDVKNAYNYDVMHDKRISMNNTFEGNFLNDQIDYLSNMRIVLQKILDLQKRHVDIFKYYMEYKRKIVDFLYEVIENNQIILDHSQSTDQLSSYKLLLNQYINNNTYINFEELAILENKAQEYINANFKRGSLIHHKLLQYKSKKANKSIYELSSFENSSIGLIEDKNYERQLANSLTDKDLLNDEIKGLMRIITSNFSQIVQHRSTLKVMEDMIKEYLKKIDARIEEQISFYKKNRKISNHGKNYPPEKPLSNNNSDINRSKWHMKDVNWALQNGNTYFEISLPIYREPDMIKKTVTKEKEQTSNNLVKYMNSNNISNAQINNLGNKINTNTKTQTTNGNNSQYFAENNECKFDYQLTNDIKNQKNVVNKNFEILLLAGITHRDIIELELDLNKAPYYIARLKDLPKRLKEVGVNWFSQSQELEQLRADKLALENHINQLMDYNTNKRVHSNSISIFEAREDNPKYLRNVTNYGLNYMQEKYSDKNLDINNIKLLLEENSLISAHNQILRKENMELQKKLAIPEENINNFDIAYPYCARTNVHQNLDCFKDKKDTLYLKQKNIKTSIDKETIEKEIYELKKEIDALDSEKNQLQSKYDLLFNDNKKKDNKISDIEAELEELKQELHRNQAILSLNNSKDNKANGDMKNMSQPEQFDMDKYNKLKEKYNKLKERVVLLDEERDSLMQKISRLECINNDNDLKISDNICRIGKLHAKLFLLMAEIEKNKR